MKPRTKGGATGSAPSKTGKTKLANPKSPAKTPVKVPQPHGGALLVGGNYGNAGGGRPPSVLRERLRNAGGDRIKILEEIADGVPVETFEIDFASVLPHVTCPKCESQMEASDPAALFMLTLKATRSAKSGDRIKAIDAMFKYGLGEEQVMVVEGDEQVKRFAELVHDAITKHAPSALPAILKQVREAWGKG